MESEKGLGCPLPIDQKAVLSKYEGLQVTNLRITPDCTTAFMPGHPRDFFANSAIEGHAYVKRASFGNALLSKGGVKRFIRSEDDSRNFRAIQTIVSGRLIGLNLEQGW